MRVRPFVIGVAMTLGSLLMVVPAVGAADLTYTPATITYNAASTTKVTGLVPKTAYTLQIYSPWGVPLIPGGFYLFSDASGTYTTTEFSPDQTNLPGVYLFEITTQDGKVVARATPTLVGTNSYYVEHRLGA